MNFRSSVLDPWVPHIKERHRVTPVACLLERPPNALCFIWAGPICVLLTCKSTNGEVHSGGRCLGTETGYLSEPNMRDRMENRN